MVDIVNQIAFMQVIMGNEWGNRNQEKLLEATIDSIGSLCAIIVQFYDNIKFFWIDD